MMKFGYFSQETSSVLYPKCLIYATNPPFKSMRTKQKTYPPAIVRRHTKQGTHKKSKQQRKPHQVGLSMREISKKTLEIPLEINLEIRVRPQ